MIHLDKNGIRWELRADVAPVLDQLLADKGRVIKESPVKLVTRHEVGGRCYYVKRYRHAAIPLRPLKFFFKPSQARKEWELAQKLELLQIPSVHHLALGERRTGGGLQESILITEGFDGVPLDQAPQVNAAAVVAFVNRMHERGVLQRDLHPGNILVHSRTGELRLVDLHGTTIQGAVTPQERAHNFALLRATLQIPVTPEVERLSILIRRQRLVHRSKRCLKHNREFAPMRLGGLKWYARLPFINENLKAILEAPDRFLQTRAEILKPGRTSTVGRADGFVLKRFNFRKLENLVKDLFRSSRAYRSYRKAYHLELLGIPTARAVAAAEQRIARVLLRSYFVMEEIPSAVGLGQYLRQVQRPERVLVQQVAELIGKLHEEGFTHRDLKESNIVLGASRKLYLLDLDGLRYIEHVPESRAAADLARLARAVADYSCVTRWDRFAFVRLYCKARGLKRAPRLTR